jgi:S1-C subfamily serine protease
VVVDATQDKHERVVAGTEGWRAPTAPDPVRYATRKDDMMSAMQTGLLGFLCWGLFPLYVASSAHAQTAQEVARKAFQSTVLLVMEDARGQPRSLGSGFLVRDGEIASNLHVVEGASTGYAKLVGQKTKYDVEGITAVDPERDLVVLKISAVRSQPLPLGNSDAVQVGDPVYAVGNPQGLEGTFSQGRSKCSESKQTRSFRKSDNTG